MQKPINVRTELLARFQFLMEQAEKHSGKTHEQLARSRRYPYIGYRYAIFQLLHEEKFPWMAMERETGYHHTTLIHGARIMREALELGTDKNFVLYYRALKEASRGYSWDNRFMTTTGLVSKWLQDNDVPAPVQERLLGTIKAISF